MWLIIFSITLFSCFTLSLVIHFDTPKTNLKTVEGASGASEIGCASSIPTVKWNNSIGINTLAMSANGAYIVAGSNNTIYLFHKSSPIPLWNHSIAVTRQFLDVAISADSSYIVAGGMMAVFICFIRIIVSRFGFSMLLEG